MDLARFLGEAAPDVLGVAHDLAQLRDRLDRQAERGVVGRVALFRRLGGRRVVACGAFCDADARRRQALDVRIVANGARDERALLLSCELLARGEPALEAMPMRAAKLENDHAAKNGLTRPVDPGPSSQRSLKCLSDTSQI